MACTLSLGNKVLHKLIIIKFSKYKKLYERDQLTIKPFDKLYTKTLQDIVIDKKENKILCNIFLLNMLMKQKVHFFYKHDHKKKIRFFCKNFIKLNLEPST